MSYQPPPNKKPNTGLWIGGAAILLVALSAALVLLLNAQLTPAAPATAVSDSVATVVAAPSNTPQVVDTPTTAPSETATPIPELGTSNVFIEYILDASGSMIERLGDGSPKIEVAQRVLTEHLRSFRPETNIGLRVYGHRLPYQQEAESCQDIELIAPVEKGQMERIVNSLQDFKVQGMTPLAASLEQAKDDFVYDASRVNSIVMLSDGIETCGGDPCHLVEDLKAQGINFTIHVIGLDVDDATQQQLSCIAEAGGGTYHDARSQQDLAAALDDVKTDTTIDEVIVPPGMNTPTPISPTPNPTPSPTPTFTPSPLPTAQGLAPLNRRDQSSVLNWIFDALKTKDTDTFAKLTSEDGLGYANYIEGGQHRTKQEFLADLEQRWASGSTCLGYVVNDYEIKVWTNDWTPAWIMTEMCYGECQQLTPPWNSNQAGFSLIERDEGWTIVWVLLNDPNTWLYGQDMEACP